MSLVFSFHGDTRECLQTAILVKKLLQQIEAREIDRSEPIVSVVCERMEQVGLTIAFAPDWAIDLIKAKARAAP